MKTKLFNVVLILLIGLGNVNAQECTKELGLFNDSAKAKITRTPTVIPAILRDFLSFILQYPHYFVFM
jgi:hypothetical protein